MCSPNAFDALRPWGQTNLHGGVLARQPSSRRRKETVAFGGFNSEIKPSSGRRAGKNRLEIKQNKPGMLGGRSLPSSFLLSQYRPGGDKAPCLRRSLAVRDKWDLGDVPHPGDTLPQVCCQELFLGSFAAFDIPEVVPRVTAFEPRG